MPGGHGRRWSRHGRRARWVSSRGGSSAGFAGGGTGAVAPEHTLLEALALLRAHALPAVAHAIAHAPAETRTRAARKPEPAEQDAHEPEEPQRLPERHRVPAEQRRREPVPQPHHDVGPEREEQC